MAKDDYNVIVFKILTYLYAVLKRKTVFDINEFKTAVGSIDENYLNDLLEMMQNEGFIKGLIFVHAWGIEPLICNDLSQMRITFKGMQFLTENSKMKEVKEFLLKNVDTISSLIKLVFI